MTIGMIRFLYVVESYARGILNWCADACVIGDVLGFVAGVEYIFETRGGFG